jgi:hypothetical protein
MTHRNNCKLYLPHYVVQEDEGTPNLSQQQMSQEACWLADVQYQGAENKITTQKRCTLLSTQEF